MVICVQCANIYEEKNNETIIKCPVCGFHMSKKKFDNLYNNAWEIIFHSYRFREAYEETLVETYGTVEIEEEESDLCVDFSLVGLNEVLVFIGIAAFSGIVGNFSSSALKMILKRIKEQTEYSIYTSEALDLISDDEKIDKFITYLNDYRNDFDGLPSKLKKEIINSFEESDMYKDFSEMKSKNIEELYNPYEGYWNNFK